MNNKKIIFFVIVGILLIFILFIVSSLGSPKDTGGKKNTSGNLKIWLVGDSSDSFTSYYNDFKADYGYKNNAEIVSFDSWEEYNLALSSANLRGEGPDVFVLNNNEKSVFIENITGIDPAIIDPDKFRSNYKGFFGDDLIASVGEGKNKQDFLIGVPVGYETLGVFYDRRKVTSKDLDNWASLNAKIAELKEKRGDIVPLGIGDGSTVEYSEDILTQFFMLEDVSSIKELAGAKLNAGLGDYFSFGSDEGVNRYNKKVSKLKASGKNNVDLFSRGEVLMLIGYPRMMDKIDEAGFSRPFLLASPFPEYIPGQGKSLVNYNYFVVNKNSLNKDISFDLLKYMTSENGIINYLDKHTHYSPAYLSLESDYLDMKINDSYNVKLEDFHNEDLVLSSFDKGIKSLYDREVVSMLDDDANYITLFTSFMKRINCVTDKVVNLNNLTSECK